MSKTKKPRGFACLTPEQRRAIASMGGQKSHRNGTAHKFTQEEASEAGKKGGAHWKGDPEHMRAIGARGGKAKKGYRERREQQQLEQESAEQQSAEQPVTQGESVPIALLAQNPQSVEPGREPGQPTRKERRR